MRRHSSASRHCILFGLPAYLPLCLCVCMYTYPQRPEEDVKFSGIGVTGSGEQPDVGTGNHILCVCVCVHGCVCPDTNQDFICHLTVHFRVHIFHF